MTNLFYNSANKGKWYGIDEIDFYFYNTNIDPEICYDGLFYNANDVEEVFYDEYIEDGGEAENRELFAEYMRTHKEDIFSLLDDVQEYGVGHLKPWNYR